jgi:isoquinoline 1-oxidoreductase
VAACAEVGIDRKQGEIKVLEVCEAFECGPIQNPANLTSQVQGCIVMGLGGALREEMQFEDGKILNASFSQYLVPRFKDVPKIDVHLVNKTDIPSRQPSATPSLPRRVFACALCRCKTPYANNYDARTDNFRKTRWTRLSAP